MLAKDMSLSTGPGWTPSQGPASTRSTRGDCSTRIPGIEVANDIPPLSTALSPPPQPAMRPRSVTLTSVPTILTATGPKRSVNSFLAAPLKSIEPSAEPHGSVGLRATRTMRYITHIESLLSLEPV
ncbi:hypothetical protein PsYK624_158840 [Phanerochaete sordida]|uniref:Uncharacterized protein n=1 Tax=Phanerochaete sordida TaxID=48140 RepID=A0A9P3LLE6_9APHY|nr:hypothetical protein PsYK624_158840 [Phanerochaete sordida]